MVLLKLYFGNPCFKEKSARKKLSVKFVKERIELDSWLDVDILHLIFFPFYLRLSVLGYENADIPNADTYVYF